MISVLLLFPFFIFNKFIADIFKKLFCFLLLGDLADDFGKDEREQYAEDDQCRFSKIFFPISHYDHLWMRMFFLCYRSRLYWLLGFFHNILIDRREIFLCLYVSNLRHVTS